MAEFTTIKVTKIGNSYEAEFYNIYGVGSTEFEAIRHLKHHLESELCSLQSAVQDLQCGTYLISTESHYRDYKRR